MAYLNPNKPPLYRINFTYEEVMELKKVLTEKNDKEELNEFEKKVIEKTLNKLEEAINVTPIF